MKIIPAASHRIMPWKNGGGRTDEIAIHPPGASLNDFAWRISMAHVEGDGPFSVFAGIDRTLTVLSGGTMRLAFADGETVTLAPGDAPYPFSGDRPANATVTAPLIDLNIMTRRGQIRHTVEHHALASCGLIDHAGGMLVLFVTEPARLSMAGKTHPLDRHDTAIIEEPGRIEIAGAAGFVFFIRLQPA